MTGGICLQHTNQTILAKNKTKPPAESISKQRMSNLRARSLRNGSWFRALSRVERGIVDLSLKYVEKIRSAALSSTLHTILGKLSQASEHFFIWRLEQVGRPLAEMMSRAAISLGVRGAEMWSKDPAYIRCLGMNYLGTRIRATSG